MDLEQNVFYSDTRVDGMTVYLNHQFIDIRAPFLEIGQKGKERSIPLVKG